MPDGFANSILGGAETLIRSAIKSANYVAGLAGWRISRDGSAELNDATIRGSISAGNGTVLLNNGGVKVVGPDIQSEMNIGGAFIARRVSLDGALGQTTVFPAAIPGNGGGTFGRTQTPTPDGNNIVNTGASFALMSGSGTNEAPGWVMRSPALTGKMLGFITIYGQSALSAVDDTHADIDVKTVHIRDQMINDSDSMKYMRGQTFDIAVSFAIAASNTQVFNFPVAFPVGVVPNVHCNIKSLSGTVGRFRCDAASITNTGFTLWSRSGDGSTQAWGAVPVQITAVVV